MPKKTKKTKSANDAVIVELLRPDGSTSLFVGRLVRQSAEEIVLADATWIASTGRRGKFLAGQPDDRAEWEPHPDGVEVSLRAPVLWQSAWDYGLTPFRTAR